MITVNFEDYPEHRLKFFALLHAITNHCFKCLFAMSPPQLKLLIDSIIWAFRHTERNVAETGLLLLEVRRGALATPAPCLGFYAVPACSCHLAASSPSCCLTKHSYSWLSHFKTMLALLTAPAFFPVAHAVSPW